LTTTTGAFATGRTVGGITFPEVIDGATTVVFEEFGSADVKTCAALITVAEIVGISKLARSTKVVDGVSHWPEVSIGKRWVPFEYSRNNIRARFDILR